MTDSMKFGPEWLRNLSADSTNPAMSNPGGGGVGSSGSLCNSATNTAAAAAAASAAKNMFPEFRYGREEMLSLFDKNCTLPDILPSFKKIFVDKVQNPLAFTPSTDEEILPQGPTIASQRPSWMQRSPVGFSSISRGTSRGGGSVERGRLRGKSIYHQTYTRPTALFEDDLRSMKSDRAWSERNGAGDTLGGIFGIGPDWNGTPASSPRKEFASHPRNMENWRRSRNEDGSGDGTVGLANSEGWRGSSGYNAPHRWGRSTSWRDEEGGNGEAANHSAGSVTIQRSYSTIGTTGSERGSFANSNVSSKSFQNSISFLNGSNRMNANAQLQKNQWPNNGKTDRGPLDGDDNLPEWAMENPSESGGTFDSTGAFLGCVDDDSSMKMKDGNNSEAHRDIMKGGRVTDSKSMERDQNSPASIDSYSSSPENLDSKQISDIAKNYENDQPVKIVKPTSETRHVEKSSEPEDATKINSSKKDATLNFETASGADYSDRMKEVADDMVEKLIMDDDNVEINANKNITPEMKHSLSSTSIPALTEINRSNYVPTGVVGILEENAHSHGPNAINLSPNHSALVAANHKMYANDVNIDHVALQQQQQQHHCLQQQLNANTGGALSHTDMNIATSTDMWYYRDPQSKVQGPFNSIEMTEWYRAGYFNDNLFVRRVCDTRFRALGELIKICNGNMPFTHSKLIPIDTQSVNIPQLHEKHHHQDDLKSEITAAADSICQALKNTINRMDMAKVLSLHFQMLQEKYVRNQELIVFNELSKSECFQQLSRSELESTMRQKVQLPEYLTSLAHFGNTLASLNPAAGHQLYGLIAECYKKGNLFGATGISQPQPHQNNFFDAETFIMNAQHYQLQAPFGNAQFCPIPISNHTENSADYNMRMYMQCENADNKQIGIELKPEFIPNSGNFLANHHMMPGAAGSPVGAVAPPLMQVWIPQMHAEANAAPHQGQLNAQPPQHPIPSLNNQWTAGRLVGIPSPVIPNATVEPANAAIVASKQLPSSMWDSNEALKPHQMPNAASADILPNQLSDLATEEPTPAAEEQNSEVVVTELQVVENKTSLDESYQCEDLHLNERNNNAGKNAGAGVKKNKPQAVSSPAAKIKEDPRKNPEEDRRRESTEEKRKQKDDKKRQSLKDEKKKQQQLEDEKRRQTDEEKERQSLIQSQRRKALLGAAQAGAAAAASASSTSPSASSAKVQQQQQTSVAPWSTQNSSSAASKGPCLAEIQKAERRERRADQQRQLENNEKQTRNAAAAESSDGAVKWNASTVPVKSFVEIQAEEAKRLAAEQLEMQRRKEQEQQQYAQSALLNGSALANSQTIWGGTKVWGSTSSAGFWEEPVKGTASAAKATAPATAASIVAAGLANNAKQSQQPSKSASVAVNARNLKKSQTVSVMQNSAKPHKASNQPPQANVTVSKQQAPSSKPQLKPTPDAEKKVAAAKNLANNPTAHTSASALKKGDDFENEFTGWCTSSLMNMNTKVDVPTFVSFLQDIESPYEVKDYIRLYLGESKEFVEFSKQFLERRSKYKNLQRAQNAHNDDMCKPAPAITPSGNENSENKTKQKKPKKNKMTKLDARILGFSVTAASGRINVGDRDYVDGP